MTAGTEGYRLVDMARTDQLTEIPARPQAGMPASAAKERQLERYAADLRETFIEERARTRQLHNSYIATVLALTNAVEARDAYTGEHAERVTGYGLRIAAEVDPGLAADAQLEFGFLLHDIGKVAVPDAILHKLEPLTDQERELLEWHPITGCEILHQVEYLAGAKQVIRHHHERWDGTGYPDGLRGEEIPLSARVFAVADALDAITTDRPYRDARSLAAARPEIVAAAGSQFDPLVVEAFERIPDQDFERISAEPA